MIPEHGYESESRIRLGQLVAVVDDDPVARKIMCRWLEQEGYRTVEHDSGRTAIAYDGEVRSAVCLDLSLGDIPGLKVLKHLKAADSAISIIVVTADRELNTAIAAMQAGAYDYVAKPIDRDRLVHAVRRGIERRALAETVQRLEHALGERAVLGTIIGRSRGMKELASQIRRVLDSEIAVCILGESGTGKELVARAIHASGKRTGSFVAINCAAIPQSLQESELFGHERGSFTGATKAYRGSFEQADGGTLFLDEVGEMSASTQAALLRTLQEKKVRRLGGKVEIPVDVRIIAATNRNLRKEVEAGRFREDLYFRLVAYPIEIPPLRDRPDDIPLLVGHFVRGLREDTGRDVSRITPEALDALARYGWPGNVRELRNVIHRSLLACRGDEISLSDLPAEVRQVSLPSLPPPPDSSLPPFSAPPLRSLWTDEEFPTLQEVEKRAIERAIKATHGNVGKAAKLLGIGRATLYRRMAELDVSESNDS
jgi:DNA-binding NtrC family response regulator